MPLAADANVPATGIAVEVSAVVDLYICLSGCHQHQKGREEFPGEEALVGRAAAFWEDGAAGKHLMAFDELIVLAAVGGFLPGGEDVTDFVAALPQLAARTVGSLALRSEQEETRERVLRHLRVLREDRDRRAGYVSLVSDLAAARKRSWPARLPALRARAGWFREHLGEGEDLASLLPPRHIALLPRYRGLVDEALRRATALVVPTVGPDLLYDLPGVLLIGVRQQEGAPAEEARRRTAKVAERLRALGDPTRLALAAYLSTMPASVSALARAFDLSQPTVSAHIRSLRSAGLLDSRRAGGMTEFRLPPERLTHLFDDAQEALFGERS